MKQPLPIGIDNFEDIRNENYYYIDKTMLIQELLDFKGEANLFTRPRRFGKTLNLSMLRYFLRIPVTRKRMPGTGSFSGEQRLWTPETGTWTKWDAIP